jgi:DNA polymerase/3'-5' exonuclease PolX
MRRKRIAPGSRLTVEFTAQEWSDLAEQTLVELEAIAQVEVFGEQRRVRWTLDDIEDAQGHVAATANHTNDTKLRRRLEKLFDRLQIFLDEYDDNVA